MARILVVDDEERILAVLARLLAAKGHEPIAVSRYDEALKRLESRDIELLISDIRLDKDNGLNLLQEALTFSPELPVIMITGYASLDTATTAMKRGAFDYLVKPLKIDELVDTVERALSYRAAALEDFSSGPVRCCLGDLVAESDAMRRVCDMIKRVAPTSTPVLILGEPGTDKLRLASNIHAASRRAEAPFVSLTCAGRDEDSLLRELFGSRQDKGAFVSAGGGTLFLDNIDAVPPLAGDRLLAFLKTGEVPGNNGRKSVTVDTRLIAGTSADLEAMVEAAVFSGDLFNRLRLFPLTAPPLRERTQDIVPLARQRLREICRNGEEIPVLTLQARDILVSYPWHGNDKELSESLQYAADHARDRQIAPDSLPEPLARCTRSAAPPPGSANRHRATALRAFLKEKARELNVTNLTSSLSEQQKKTVRMKMTPADKKPPVLVPAFLTA